MKTVSKIIISSSAGLCFLLISIFSQNNISVKAEGKDELTVMTYNIHQGFDNTGKVDPRKFLVPIQKANPDIIGLQESETNRLIAGNYDIVLWLAKKLKMYHYFGPPTKKSIYGVSILSKYPLKNSKTFYLDSIYDQRVAIETTIEHNRKEIKVLVTHLGLSLDDRYNQTKWIYDNKIVKSQTPLIVMGDFNTEDWEDFTEIKKPVDLGDGLYPNRLEVYINILKQDKETNITTLAKKENYRGLSDYRKIINDTWKIKHPNDAKSYTWFDTNEALGRPKVELHPPVRIDYIFTSKEFKIVDSKIINNKDTRRASDHLPVITKLKI